MQEIFNFFPMKISQKIKEQEKMQEENTLEEIRIRNNKPIILKYSNREKLITQIINTNDMLEITIQYTRIKIKYVMDI